MKKYKTKIKEDSKGKYIVFPKPVVKAAELKEGSIVTLKITDGKTRFVNK
jgi:hypothetical protein